MPASAPALADESRKVKRSDEKRKEEQITKNKEDIKCLCYFNTKVNSDYELNHASKKSM